MAVELTQPISDFDISSPRPDVRVEGLQVRHLMTTTPVTSSPDTTVREAERLMLQERVHHLLVVADGQLVGLLADHDVQTVLPSPATSLSKWELLYLLDKLTVREAMTSDVVTVAPDKPVSEALRLMLAHRIGALPVVEVQQVVGILTRSNILQAVYRTQVGKPVAA